MEKYPFSSSKVNSQNQKTIYFAKNLPNNDYIQTKKNIRQILQQTSYYADSNPQPIRSSVQSNKIEISSNIKISKNDQDKSYDVNFNKTHYAYSNLRPNSINTGTAAKFYEFKANKTLKNESVTCFNPSMLTSHLNRQPIIATNMMTKNSVDINILNASNDLNNKSNINLLNATQKNSSGNKGELVPQKSKNVSNLRKIGTGNKTENYNQQKFYSPPNYTKKRELNSKNADVTNEDYDIEANEGWTKLNTININVIQNKLILMKRDSENEIFSKTKIQSQHNSPYLLTENSKKNREVEGKPIELKFHEKINDELNNANSKTAIQSFKDFSESFMKKTKNLFKFETKKNMRTKCHCDPMLNDNNSSCSRALQWIQYNYKLVDLENLKKDYEQMQKVQSDEKSVDQIEKDLPRTFPSYPYFEKESEGSLIFSNTKHLLNFHFRNQCLRRVLITFSNYDPQLGYILTYIFLKRY